MTGMLQIDERRGDQLEFRLERHSLQSGPEPRGNTGGRELLRHPSHGSVIEGAPQAITERMAMRGDHATDRIIDQQVIKSIVSSRYGAPQARL